MMVGEMLGRIHSFETLGGLDGPGLRCVVFFQGCPMHCLYCQNPDTWDAAGGQAIDSDEVIRTAARYKPYFGAAGGLTLSGGEPLMQAPFAGAILAGAKRLGIHTAIDTCGYRCGPDVIELLRATDLVILDIKHTHPARHQELTGRPLENTLAFLAQVGQLGIALWVRQVIVPGWNDTPEAIRALAEIIRPIASLRKAELLAYHRMARWKWEALGRKYPLAGVAEAPPEQVAKLQELLDSLLAARP
jgi:pyruvate formate lyase activating enzyme